MKQFHSPGTPILGQVISSTESVGVSPLLTRAKTKTFLVNQPQGISECVSEKPPHTESAKVGQGVLS